MTPGAVCADDKGPPKCVTSCPRTSRVTVMAMFECSCEWEKVAFCATEAPGACGSRLCVDGQLGAGADPTTCSRVTDGLVVPASEVLGACEGSGAYGTQAVSYEACHGGKPAKKTRRQHCERKP